MSHPAWWDAVAVWESELGPSVVTVRAALALVYCPVTLPRPVWEQLGGADATGQVGAVVTWLLRRERERRGEIPLGGFVASAADVESARAALSHRESEA